MKRYILPIAVLLVVSFVSCIDVDSRIRINSDGSGIFDLSYQLHSDLDEYGRLDGIDPRSPIPLERDAFEQTALAIEGLDLVRYRRYDDGRSIEVRFEFDDLSALAQWYGGDESLVSTDNGLRFHVADAVSTGDSPFSPLEEELLSSYLVAIDISVPAAVQSVNIGEFSARNARIELPLNEYLAPEADIVWEITW